MATAPTADTQGEMSAASGTLTLRMVDALGSAIVMGRYRDRAFPTEAELAKEHAVSRSVTREAVKMISAKGMLGSKPKAGTTVLPEERWNLFDTDVLRWLMEHKLSVELLRYFSELRMMVEPQAAAFAARRAKPAEVNAIRSGLDKMKKAAEGDGNPLEADIEFHVAILRASGNPFIRQFRDVVDTALRSSIRVTNRQGGGKLTIKDHEAVYDAIASGDSAGASQAMAKLVGDVLAYLDTTDSTVYPPGSTGADDRRD